MANEQFKVADDDSAFISAEDPDAPVKARTLREVLSIYPGTMTLEELVRELTFASADFEERDGVQRAVRDLAAGGLLHRNGDFVVPTRAAVNFSGLMDFR
jgi:hypothetical protein